jgi:methylated-DNA-[protein]-cysteine S-methyltransferase
MAYVYKIIVSPVGALKLVASDSGLAAILWEKDDPMRVKLGEMTQDERHPILTQAEQELGEYFAGNRNVFTVDLDMAGTEFQEAGLAGIADDPLR